MKIKIMNGIMFILCLIISIIFLIESKELWARLFMVLWIIAQWWVFDMSKLFKKLLNKPTVKILDDFVEIKQKIDKDLTLEARISMPDFSKKPTDEQVNLYYKMYLKKRECDDEWTTHEPIILNEFKLLKHEIMYAMSCDAFMGGFNSPPTMIRFNNYESMVKKEEKNEN